MTTEERIAELEGWATACVQSDPDEFALLNAVTAVVWELRALRLMLREEIREAAFPLKAIAEGVGPLPRANIIARYEPYDQDNPIASRAVTDDELDAS